MKLQLITIDGPSGVGKGTLALLLANYFKLNYLNSGSIYRAIAYLSEINKIEVSDTEDIISLITTLQIQFPIEKNNYRIICNKKDITNDINNENCATRASIISSNTYVRKSLVSLQRSFFQEPGLVAEGRDMGSVIFKASKIKIFLTASNIIKAQRRHKQLKQKGINVSLPHLIEELDSRDRRDVSRKISPLVIPNDAYVIDTDKLTINEVFDKTLKYINK
ncbi:MAG: (d)CMP kinase [Gammaproteobacteria bacterium]|jgi:cytidylate kinase|nr:(d)CMP kinase [Gammaproteobacteria bacterium]MBT6074414.1 (d)CMP kinase [Gammaproteobacteria bacterium]